MWEGEVNVLQKMNAVTLDRVERLTSGAIGSQPRKRSRQNRNTPRVTGQVEMIAHPLFVVRAFLFFSCLFLCLDVCRAF